MIKPIDPLAIFMLYTLYAQLVYRILSLELYCFSMTWISGFDHNTSNVATYTYILLYTYTSVVQSLLILSFWDYYHARCSEAITIDRISCLTDVMQIPMLVYSKHFTFSLHTELISSIHIMAMNGNLTTYITNLSCTHG